MKRLIGLLISGALVLGSAGLTFAQESVLRETKRVATATGKTVEKTTKKIFHKGAHATRKGSSKVEKKTETK
jgi:hypothetical protein